MCFRVAVLDGKSCHIGNFNLPKTDLVVYQRVYQRTIRRDHFDANFKY